MLKSFFSLFMLQTWSHVKLFYVIAISEIWNNLFV